MQHKVSGSGGGPWCSGQSLLYLHSMKDGNENRRQRKRRRGRRQGARECGRKREGKTKPYTVDGRISCLQAHLGFRDLQNVLAFCVIGYLLQAAVVKGGQLNN